MANVENRKRREERAKLAAGALSNLGVASVVTGFIAPLLTGKALLQPLLIALAAGLGLHLVAQAVLHLVVVSPERSDEQPE